MKACWRHWHGTALGKNNIIPQQTSHAPWVTQFAQGSFWKYLPKDERSLCRSKCRRVHFTHIHKLAAPVLVRATHHVARVIWERYHLSVKRSPQHCSMMDIHTSPVDCFKQMDEQAHMWKFSSYIGKILKNQFKRDYTFKKLNAIFESNARIAGLINAQQGRTTCLRMTMDRSNPIWTMHTYCTQTWHLWVSAASEGGIENGCLLQNRAPKLGWLYPYHKNMACFQTQNMFVCSAHA